MARPKKGGLGKGLDALFVDNTTQDVPVSTLPLSEIEPNSDQPRKTFDPQALAELADSIREHGVLQPLLVRPLENGSYQLIAGERRWRASRMVGLTQVPVVIREMTDQEATELALIENLQRENLSPVEEANGYRQLMDRYSLTQEQIAARVGRSRPAVANSLRLLSLPQAVLELLEEKKLTAGHARALLGLSSQEEMLKAASQVAKGQLTVRDVERMAKGSTKRSPKGERPKGDPFYTEMELALGEELQRRIKISPSKKGQGVLEIAFHSKEDLQDLAQALCGLQEMHTQKG